MSAHESDAGSRSFEVEVALDAPVEAVWAALTEAEQLQSWFPLEAEVVPGAGGSIRISWGPGIEGDGAIEIWEPGRHLRVAERAADGSPTRIAVDYHLDSRGDGTVLRIVHSGFGASADWDEYLDAIQGGWAYFLWNLRLYLERHRGVPRRMSWTRRPTSLDRSEVWERLLRLAGLAPGRVGADGAPLGEHQTLRPGERAGLEGELVLCRPSVHLAWLLPELDDGALLVELEPGTETWHLGLWLSTYGIGEDRAAPLQAWVEALADEVLAGA